MPLEPAPGDPPAQLEGGFAAARRDRGDPSWPELEAPATPGRIQHAIALPGTQLRL